LKPGPPIPRIGPCRPGAAKLGAPGIGGMTPIKNQFNYIYTIIKGKLNLPRPAARPAPCAAAALVGTRAIPTSLK
jgi:hypothetical protein